MNIVLKNGKVYDSRCNLNDITNIWIEDGVITYIGCDLNKNSNVIDCTNKIIVPGIIDMHTHCFPSKTDLGIMADEIGIKHCISSIVDAGSCGCDDLEDFKNDVIKTNETSIYSFINYSKVGLVYGNKELSKVENIDEEQLERCIKENRCLIKGIKLRASESVVGELGFLPIKKGKEFAKKIGLPVMVHIGNMPPKIEEVLQILEEGDILTHSFHGKVGGILDEHKNIKPIVQQKYDEGILFDVGHGAASFDFRIAKAAIDQGIIPSLISSDLHARNYKTKIKSFEEIMSKLYACHMKITDIIDAVSINSAKVLKVNNEIRVGNIADLNILSIEENEKLEVIDSNGNKEVCTKLFEIQGLIKNNKVYRRAGGSYGD